MSFGRHRMSGAIYPAALECSLTPFRADCVGFAFACALYICVTSHGVYGTPVTASRVASRRDAHGRPRGEGEGKNRRSTAVRLDRPEKFARPCAQNRANEKCEIAGVGIARTKRENGRRRRSPVIFRSLLDLSHARPSYARADLYNGGI